MAGFRSVSLADQVFEKLENDIVAGVYPKGEIITEMKLVEELGVSRTPIREALRRLEQERLICETGKGMVILGITPEELSDIMSIRQRTEELAVYHVIENLTEEGAARLSHIGELQDFYYQKNDTENLRKMDDEFHEVLYELSGRTVIRDVLQPLHKKTQRYRKKSIEDATRLAKSLAEHKAILKAVLEKDTNKAMELMTMHITNAKESMIARLKDESENSSGKIN